MTISSSTPSASPMAERLDFIGFDAAAAERLARISPSIMRHIGPALTRFYDSVEETPQVARFFSGRGQMDVAQDKQERHWSAIARGRLDADYYESSLRIGNRHARIGLEPQWYIGGYALVLETLIRGMMADWMAEEAPRLRKRKPAEAAAAAEGMAQTLADMIKAVLVDVDLAVSTYFAALEEKIEEGRHAAEERARVQQDVLGRTGEALGALAAGHLDTRIEGELPEGFAQLGADFNAAAASLEETIVGIRASVDAIASDAGAVAGSAQDLADRLSRQAAAIEQSSAALDEVAANVNETAIGTSAAAELAGGANKAAQDGGAVVENAVEAMQRIEQSSAKISSIISVIDEIALQTNLLALNAAVEAARAGEAGRGFAVVATEVRSLAQRSAQAARDVAALISTSGKEVENGVGLVRRTGEALSGIVEQVGHISDHMDNFSAASGHQAAALNEINAAIVQLDGLTRENAVFVERAGEAGRDLETEVEDLYQRLSAFRTTVRQEPDTKRKSG
ncbi:methyl-accepting chemotaxis protein [Pelagibacterium sp. 26DY04]|uniref:methyl-accepting chemotaxis protein n=1 Tax=Pelagibacterium sp. 26DY04 TaxID=2967130 RepID=UPI0028150326|nr:methyl-accepting chemotaxis protein [Pelagibacterium sp. 26DY04]WMT87728.1 methyl-accepting chemotaxis protein [Pelagibacterium sp. 26DY04]